MLIPRTFADGETVLRRDVANDRFWIVTEGEIVSDHPEAVYRTGDYFGEVELFTAQRTVSTFTAKGACQIVCMTREHFMAHVPLTGFVSDGHARTLTGTSAVTANDDDDDDGGANRKPRARRMGQAAEPTTGVVGGADDGPVVPAQRKPEETRARIKRAVKAHILFNRLEPEQFDLLVDVMTEHAVPAGTVVIREGEKGNHFYVVDQGECDAFSSAVLANGGLVKSFRPGDSFGELALMYNCPRTATISARTDCVLWSLDRTSFRRILLKENARKARLYEQFLEKARGTAPHAQPRRARAATARARADARACGVRAGAAVRCPVVRRCLCSSRSQRRSATRWWTRSRGSPSRAARSSSRRARKELTSSSSRQAR